MLNLKERYFIKIVPQRGDVVHRFEITRRHIVAVSVVLSVVLLGSLIVGGIQYVRTRAQIVALQALTHGQLRSINARAAVIHNQLQVVQRQNQQLRQLIGAPPDKKPKAATGASSYVAPKPGKGIAQLERNVAQLASVSESTLSEAARLRRLTMRVLNVRHLQDLARAREIAEIPSIDPVAGAPVVGCFCFRTSPDYGFHEGVDLGANYGEVVRASAAGTIASAGWDGGYGNKIDIDHGNGYHTWYAHLERMDVAAGTYVRKGEAIGLVGATGFATGPHLHYQVMLNGKPIDPTPFLDGVPNNVLASLP